jgi:hypothetical protein
MINPENFGKFVLVTIVLVAFAFAGFWIIVENHPKEFEAVKQTCQDRNKSINTIQYDTITKNDTTYIIKKHYVQDTTSIFKKIK